MLPFDDVVFPELLNIGFSGGPRYSISIMSRRNGSEFRFANRAHPVHSYDLAPLLKSETAIQIVTAFFIARNGSNRGFRFKDWFDYTTAGDDVSDPTGPTPRGVIASEDGELRFYKEYSSDIGVYYRRITKPRLSTITVYSGGVLVDPEDYTINDRGVIDFPGGTPGDLSWCGHFDVPVRFTPDSDESTSINLEAFKSGGMTISVEEIPVFDGAPEWIDGVCPEYPTTNRRLPTGAADPRGGSVPPGGNPPPKKGGKSPEGDPPLGPVDCDDYTGGAACCGPDDVPCPSPGEVGLCMFLPVIGCSYSDLTYEKCLECETNCEAYGGKLCYK